jgi:hypothetical protein
MNVEVARNVRQRRHGTDNGDLGGRAEAMQSAGKYR